MPLTDAKLRNLKGAVKTQKIADGGGLKPSAWMNAKAKAAKSTSHLSCRCELATAPFDLFTSFRSVGTDTTEGRFADVVIDACTACGRLWLRYSVEYEAFSRSGRWARGLIDPETAQAIEPAEAQGALERSWYLYGGSYFDGVSGRRTGSMSWR